MALYEAGPLTQYNSWQANVIPNDVFGVAINWFVNRTPVITRFPKLPVGAPQFIITNDNYRPRSATLANSVANSDTTLTMVDGTEFDTGDVVLIDSEFMLVTGTYASRGDSASTVLNVTRGYASTSNVSHTNTAVLNLVTNTRDGAELNINSVSRIPSGVTQYCQTVQHAYQVGGALQADINYTTGFSTPLDRDRMLAMQHTMDDFESAIYSGKGVVMSAQATRPMMVGLGPPGGTTGAGNGLIVTNYTANPTNYAAYKPSDLIRDTVQAAFQGGGNPDLLIVSTDFMAGLAVWGSAAMRVPAGETEFGTPIDLFEAPFLTGISIVPAPLLKLGTAICLSTPEVRIRLKRPMFDKPRGSRGDAFEGDIIMEGAIELDNQAHHAFVTGITGFASA